MNPTLSRPRARALATPRLQLSVLRRAESFVCRRCTARGYGSSEEKFDAPYHFHPEIELLLMETSHGTRYVAGSIESYGPGDLVLIGANVPHVFQRDPGADPPSCVARSIVVQFLPDFLGAEFFNCPEMQGVRRLLEASRHGLHFGRATVRRLAPLLRRLLSAEGAGRVALLLEILDGLAVARARPLASGALGARVLRGDLGRVARVRAHVERHYADELTAADAARLVALSPSSFSRWFRAATGKPFIQFLTDVRLAHAFGALTETGKPITEIAFECGFNSVSHFTNRFRAIRGMSPREFRQRVGRDLAAAGGAR